MEFNELQQIVESNARSIQALSDRIAELIHVQEEAQQERRELREATIGLERLSEGIVNLLGSLDEDRPTMLRKLNTIENKLDQLIERRS
jgi:chromosome segregation ATPase